MSTRWKVVVAVIVVAAAAWWPLEQVLIRWVGVSEITVARSFTLQFLGLEDPGVDVAARPPVRAAAETPPEIELDDRFVPFREIGSRLGPRGYGNDVFPFRGAAVFDANGDDRPDIYLPDQGRIIGLRMSDEQVLLDEKLPPKPNALFINLGNDAAGDPVFKSVQELAAANDEFVREELLIENKYNPRSSLDEDEFGPGRVGVAALPADFDGDGRLDLYVLNFHYGMMGQTHQMGYRVYPAPNNIGRAARTSREALVLRAPSFLWTDRTDGLRVTVDFGPEPEPEGKNVLYLNRGDRDGDGLPEWEDVTDRTGLGGRWASASASVADFDRDGDLDVYVANFHDPDFWGFGDTRFAGQRNQLYINQLVETGELRFIDKAGELGGSTHHIEEGLNSRVYFPAEDRYVPASDQKVDGVQVGERADHAWAALLGDWNGDQWPDLIVANDLSNRLRVYENVPTEDGTGRRLEYQRRFDDSTWDGCWMGMSMGDLDGDMREEVLVTNCGAQVMSARNNALFIEDASEASMLALAVLNYTSRRSTMHHAVLTLDPERGLEDRAAEVLVQHSPYIPPDMSQLANFAPGHEDFFEELNFANSLTSYEFALNAPMFDVDNDGDLDLYLAGSLMRGNDDFIGDWSGSPGRLLVNESSPGRFQFRDRTLEYQLLNIQHMDYSSNPPRRPAPGTGWHKRDYIYLTDTDSYAGMGIDASQSAVHDIFRMHEAAFGVYVSDLNQDGLQDLVVTHMGGYNSLSPDARNLKVEFAGRRLAVPAPNKVVKPPTTFEPGPTFIHINGGPPRGSEAHWADIRLIDRTAYNPTAIGAKLVVNGSRLLRAAIDNGSAFGASANDVHAGLGAGALESLEIVWPSGDMTPQSVTFDPPVRDRRVCVERGVGLVDCPPPAARYLLARNPGPERDAAPAPDRKEDGHE